jgi:hypothetical protein
MHLSRSLLAAVALVVVFLLLGGTACVGKAEYSTDSASNTPTSVEPEPVAHAPAGAPAKLTLTLTSDAQVLSVGQEVSLVATVTNEGGNLATAVAPVSLSQTGAGQLRVVAMPAPAFADIAPGASQRYAFRYSAMNTGAVTFEVGAQGNDEVAGSLVSADRSKVLLVIESAASLTVDSVSVPARVNVGAEFTVTAKVSNGGQAAARVVTPAPLTLSVPNAALLVSGPTPPTVELAGGAQETFTWTYRATAATEALKFTASAVGVDAHSGDMRLSTSAVSSPVALDLPAALELAFNVPATLTTGQTFLATLVIRNTGGSVAKGVTAVPGIPTATATAGNAGATSSDSAPAAADIAGGASATFRWSFVATGTGAFRLNVQARGTDANSQQTVASLQAQSNAASVLAPGALVVTAFTTPATIQRGQAFNVAMTVRNDGGVTANGVVPSPNPPTVNVTGTANATTASSPPAVSLAAGASTTFTWSYTENGSGTGTVAFTAGARGTDSTSGALLQANGTQTSPVSVVSPPSLVVESVTIPARISRGQGVTASVVVRNAGGTAANGVLPTLAVEATGPTTVTWGTAPGAVALAPGARTTFTFTGTESGTDAGAFGLVATAKGTDALRSTAISSVAVRSGLCTVQTAAELQVSAFLVPASLPRGQPFAVTLTVINSGQATANAVIPTPSPPTPTTTGNAAASTNTTLTAVTLAGGAKQSFTWLYSETGTGSGTLQFATRVRGTDANSGVAVATGLLSTNVANVVAQCDISLYPGISISDVANDFTTNVYPLMTRTSSGCTSCHIPGSARLFVVAPTGSETFYGARASGYLANTPGSILDRLTSSDATAKMPRGLPSWTSSEIDRVSQVVCKLKAYDAAAGSIPADEQFPPNLLEAYTGPAITTYDNPFINFSQLTGRVKQVFGTGWVVGGVDKLQQNIALFGGVNFTTSFVEARSATPEFLTGLDSLSKDMCSQAVADRTKGPFVGVDVAAELVDTPASADRLFEAEAMTKSTGAASGVGWNLYTNGTVSTSVDFTATGSYTFTIRAYGTQAGTEPPNMELRMDGVLLKGFAVPNTAYAAFTFTTTVNVGRRVMAVGFTNDFNDATGDRNLIIDSVKVAGPAGAGTGTTREVAAKANIDRVYRAMLYRAANPTDLSTAYTLLKDLQGLSVPLSSAWSGLCEALVRHPDFLFTRPPTFDTAAAAEKQRLLLVKLSQDLVARPPTALELNDFTSGAKSYDAMVDGYLASTEFRDYYFYKMRLRTESSGSTLGDEPARLWTYLMLNGQPFQQLLSGDYSVSTTWAKQTRPIEHGKTGVLTMKGFIQGKPGLPHYNYAARVMSDFMGTIFDIPPEVFDQRATATASSTVDPTSICYSCHQNLTPLAHQRLRWDDDGNYRTVDATGATIDDSDRGLVPAYAFKGQGLQAFSTVAVKKEAFVRRMFNAHAQLTLGRSMRHTADERGLYKQLWDTSLASNGNLKTLLKAIVTSSSYRRM